MRYSKLMCQEKRFLVYRNGSVPLMGATLLTSHGPVVFMVLYKLTSYT